MAVTWFAPVLAFKRRDFSRDVSRTCRFTEALFPGKRYGTQASPGALSERWSSCSSRQLMWNGTGLCPISANLRSERFSDVVLREDSTAKVYRLHGRVTRSAFLGPYLASERVSPTYWRSGSFHSAATLSFGLSNTTIIDILILDCDAEAKARSLTCGSVPDPARTCRPGSAWIRHYAASGGTDEWAHATGTGHPI